MLGLENTMISSFFLSPGIFTGTALWFIFSCAVFTGAQHLTFAWSDSREVSVISVAICESVSGKSPQLML